MNQNRKTVSTGPVTQEGKTIASKNATTKGIFAKGYLPWEDPAEQQALVQGLVKTWKADQHPERMTFIRDIEEADLRLSRTMNFERIQIEAAMQSLDVAIEFCQKAGFAPSTHLSMPHWYFQDDELGEQEKRRALYVDLVQEEALELKRMYSDHIVPTIAKEFPNLYSYVMSGQREGASFIAVLGAQFKQSAPTLNLGVVSNEIGEKYKHHLIWAYAWQRYEIIIAGIRARVVAQIVSEEKTMRYLIAAQNRKIKANQALASLTQLDWQKEDRICIALPEVLKDTPVLKEDPKLVEAKNVELKAAGGQANDASFTVRTSA
jgi:hypothetical protein